MRFMWLAHIMVSFDVLVKDPGLLMNAAESHGCLLASDGWWRSCYRSVLRSTALRWTSNLKTHILTHASERSTLSFQTCITKLKDSVVLGARQINVYMFKPCNIPTVKKKKHFFLILCCFASSEDKFCQRSLKRFCIIIADFSVN